MPTEPLSAWTKSSFCANGIERAVFRRGSGPAVIVIHELPGITPRVSEFADDVVGRGFTVVMPDLVGTPGKQVSGRYLVASLAKVCIAKEFTAWATDKPSHIVGWLRALARSVHAEVGGSGVGAVGMCFSGGFALGMMVDEIMLAPVLAQPSLPIASGIGAAKRGRSIGLSAQDAEIVAGRAAAGCQVLGLRFAGDPLVGTRFQALRELLGEAFVAVEIPSNSKRDHSVLTEQRDEASVNRVLDFLVEKLQP